MQLSKKTDPQTQGPILRSQSESGKTRLNNTRTLVSLAFMAALSVVLVYLLHFPLFPAAPYLEYDPADIPIFISTFAFGPVAGLLLTVIASVIQGLTVSASSGIVGICMHIFATGSFVLTAGLIYRRNKTKKQAIFALLSGVLVMTASMVVWNILFTPLFAGMPREAIYPMLLPVIIPFNLIKSGINALVTLLVYKSVGKLLKG